MSELNELFIKYGTDKSSLHHNYTPNYEDILNPMRNDELFLLVLGIGGYHFIDRGGGDLRAFKEYLPNTKIVGIDIYDKSFLDQERIVTYICGQENSPLLYNLIDFWGNPNIIIDDASHINPLTIKSFEILFPLLNAGGTYIIEDVHTSYWKEIASDGTDFGGGTHDNTVINYFKYLIDGNLNKGEATLEFRDTPSKDFQIGSITFYNKMIVIKKK